MKFILITLALLCCFQAALQAESKRGWRQLIPDTNMKRGITLLSQKDHSDGDAVRELMVHRFYPGEAAPLWKLAQWDSGPDLAGMLAATDKTEISDGRWRCFGLKNGEMSFLLDSSLYYNGRPAIQGDYWPHLLAECPDFGFDRLPEDKQRFYKCSADSMVVSFDFRLPECVCTETEGDWVRAAQFLLYFYVSGTKTSDFCWFGMSLFDNRVPKTKTLVMIDGGKPDASGALIYNIGSERLFPETENQADGKWHHVRLELKPFLEDMLKEGIKRGIFSCSSLDEMKINGMNIGWETIGTFRHTALVRNFKLTGYIFD